MTHSTAEFLGELRLGRQLTTVRQVAAGGIVIVGGLAFLLVGTTPLLTGPRAVVASVLAGLVVGLTLLSVLELLPGSSERGGTYVMIHETLGGPGALLAGWSILAGSVSLVAALTQVAASHVSFLVPGIRLPVPYMALALLGLLVLIQLLQVLPPRALLWPLILILVAGLGFALLSTMFRRRTVLFLAMRGEGMSGMVPLVGWLAASYVGVEAILASRRQVRHPGQLLPSAMLSTLVLGCLAFALIGIVSVGLSPSASRTDTAFAELLATGGQLPQRAIGTLILVVLVLATNGCMMVAARQMHALSRDGALPPALRHVRRPFPMPPGLFMLLAIITAPLIAWVSPELLTGMAAGLFLVTMTLLNIAAIRSYRTEPDRRRTFVVPFAPLVPVSAAAINLALLVAQPRINFVGVALWLLFGLLFYLAYARRHQVAAQAGVVVFGSDQRETKEAGAYRILVPVGPGEERRRFLRLATALAHQLGGEVVPLQVIPMRDPLAIEEGRRMARERNTLFKWSLRLSADAGVPTSPITRLARSIPQGIIDTAAEEQCDLILLPWELTAVSQGSRMGHVVDPVVRRAPCDVAVVAYRSKEQSTSEAEGVVDTLRSILVPMAGGPHAPLAARMALALAREQHARVTVVYVIAPEASDEEIAAAQARLQQTVIALREQETTLPGLNGHPAADGVPIDSRVISADSVVAGIANAGADHDLVLIGASEESLIDQMLFGNLPEQVARTCPTPVVMVKHYRGLRRFWLQRTWEALYEALPDLSAEERVGVYKRVRRDARPDVDFFVMMGLATMIAAMGLLKDSPAVIIGAMLVAPLFTPILALSLAITQGDARLARLAVESMLKGIALTIGLALLLTPAVIFLAPEPIVLSSIHEIVSRSKPDLVDLMVALASGAAGAYAIARKDVAAALPGVAIAAALVPPLAVVGIGLARANAGVAVGSGLLFITNLVAVTLAGSISLLLLGFRPARRDERKAYLRLGLATTLVLLVFVAILLVIVSNS